MRSSLYYFHFRHRSNSLLSTLLPPPSISPPALSPPSISPPVVSPSLHGRSASTFQAHRVQVPAATSFSSAIQFLKRFESLIKTLSENPRAYKALRGLDSMLTHTYLSETVVSVMVIDFLSQINKLQRGRTVLVNLKSKGKVSDYFLYSLVFDFLVIDRKIDDVETLWHEICGSEVKIGISEYVIYVSRYGNKDELTSLCERILRDGRVLRRESYVALVGALCRVNEAVLAKGVVNRMKDNGFIVDNWSYFVMFQCFCRNGDVDEADLILRNLVLGEFSIDVCIYGSFMYALCKSGKFREADKLFCKLIKRESSGSLGNVETLREGRRVIFQLDFEGAIPEIMAYEACFRSLCSVGMVDDAELLLKKMMKKSDVPQTCVYGSFIKALCRIGREEDAIEFFNAQKRKGVVGVEELGSYIITGLCGNGKIDEAREIFNDVTRGSNVFAFASACNCILDSYWKEGRVLEAEELFERLRSDSFGPPDLSSYTIMVKGYFQQGNIPKALRIFGEVPSAKLLVNCTLYDIIIEGLISHRRAEQVLRYLNKIIEDGHVVSVNRWKVLLHSLIASDGMPSRS